MPNSHIPWDTGRDGAILALNGIAGERFCQREGAYVPQRRHGAQPHRLHQRHHQASALLSQTAPNPHEALVKQP